MSKYTEACKTDGIKRTFGAWMKIFSDKDTKAIPPPPPYEPPTMAQMGMYPPTYQTK